jgi:hypothetical protein
MHKSLKVHAEHHDGEQDHDEVICEHDLSVEDAVSLLESCERIPCGARVVEMTETKLAIENRGFGVTTFTGTKDEIAALVKTMHLPTPEQVEKRKAEAALAPAAH